MNPNAQLIVTYLLGVIGMIGMLLSGFGWMLLVFAIICLTAAAMERDALAKTGYYQRAD